ncbi:hypothetical protein EVAR_28444_1 [Eumeta japonica]|uniref:Uncharacterized protein n=1 Tax=Eumeta variegata TaxID=151549 RepID=A0A4C1V8F4_EUMVA|nr:hypothetical protein EVAR_28444_1 [Eumeta japonica]
MITNDRFTDPEAGVWGGGRPRPVVSKSCMKQYSSMVCFRLCALNPINKEAPAAISTPAPQTVSYAAGVVCGARAAICDAPAPQPCQRPALVCRN